MSRIVIVGGGVSGLSLAFRLQSLAPAADITILERLDRPGGTLWTERRDGFQVEIGPNGFLDNKPGTVDLCRDLGLGDRLQPPARTPAATATCSSATSSAVCPTASAVSSPATSSACAANSTCSRSASAAAGPKPATSPSTRSSAVGPAREVAETLADAFVTGIYAGDPQLLSVRSRFPASSALEAEHGSVLKGMAAARRSASRRAGSRASRAGAERMWSFRDGLRVLAETLVARLSRPPLLGVAVRRVAEDRGRLGRSSATAATAGTPTRWS